jgi:hypothetical protein
MRDARSPSKNNREINNVINSPPDYVQILTIMKSFTGIRRSAII